MPPKAKTCPIVILRVSGEINDDTVKISSEVTVDSLKGHFKKKAVVEQFGSYPYKALTLFLFGALNGEEGEENSHQLPPPYDSTPVYSDIVILASNDENSFKLPAPFKQEDYESFYSKQFGGYESEEDDLVDVEEGKEFEAEDEEVEVDEEDEAPEEEEAEAAEEVVEEEEKPKKRKRAAVKPVVLNMVGPANAYPNKPIVSEEAQLQTETDPQPLTAPHRQAIFRTIQTLFAGKLKEEQMATLESCIYNGAIHEAKERKIIRIWDYPLFVHMYKMRARKILSNFDEDSYVANTELFELFRQGTIDFKALAAMNTYELFPSRWRDQFEKQQIREKKQLEGNRNMATDQFLCTRCWKRECTYYEMQTRSADEPMTIFINCVNCGKHWRQ
jgi:transcription elongation factor S-II